MQRISDTKLGHGAGLHRSDAPRRMPCRIQAVRVHQGGLPAQPISESRGHRSGPRSRTSWARAAYSRPPSIKASSDFQKTAAIMKLVINGDAAAGTIEMDGFDYHTGDRATGEMRDLNLGNCIGAVSGIRRAAGQAGDDLCVQRRFARERRHDRQLGRRVAAKACGRRTIKTSPPRISWSTTRPARPMPAQTNPEMSLQLGYFNPDGSQNTTSSPGGQQRAEPGADGGAQLHGAARHERHGQLARPLIRRPISNNTLGSGTAHWNR